ncbi:MAG TPA: class I SAM-dependent methyltransferase [Thermohalobaculum sp.]|nr:class I SAM-dependent methyltransferase [Thermohalobaculum sp.]
MRKHLESAVKMAFLAVGLEVRRARTFAGAGAGAGKANLKFETRRDMLRSTILRNGDSEPAVIHAISDSETMMDGDLDRYLSVGVSALKAIHSIIGEWKPRTILDLPCGHGRVARHLAAAYPSAQLYVSDLDEEGAAFCAKTFEATELSSDADFDAVHFEVKFDLIWVGSLITHLSRDDVAKFFRFLFRHLSDDGVAIVTSHGEFVAGRISGSQHCGKSLYGLSAEGEAEVVRDYFMTGFGFAPYHWSDSYGISVSSRQQIHKLADEARLTVTAYHGHAWDQHQDVSALRKK